MGYGAENLDKTQIGQAVLKTKDQSSYQYALMNYAGTDVLAISKSIKSGIDGSLIGTLIVTLKESHVSNLYQPIDIGDGSSLLIVDSNGIRYL